MINNHKFLLECSCVICKKIITVQNLARHVKTHFDNSPKSLKFCPKCNKIHSKPGIFCSKSCANSRIPSQHIKNKISESLKKTYLINPFPRFTKISQCKVCGKFFPGKKKTCSNECFHQTLSLAGKNSAHNQQKRSKDEINLYEMCYQTFQHVEHNQPIFNGWDADILIYDIKAAILWNGPWHYKEMNIGNHSLKQVRNGDHIKIKEIENFGWIPLVFEDDKFTPESAFHIIQQYNKIFETGM
jgi:predicted nucleic acid-binding Zn ribbon protein